MSSNNLLVNLVRFPVKFPREGQTGHAEKHNVA